MIATLRTQLATVAQKLDLSPPTIVLERPRQIEFGDLASNLPLICAKQARKAPLDLAHDIIACLDLDGAIFASVEAAKPGFLNFRFTPAYMHQLLQNILAAGPKFGSNNSGAGKRALVEFVSANPTGPLTVGHGRGAILGDTVCNILAWNGYTAEREYYYNNAGRQMRMLGQSLQARYLEELGQPAAFPEDGYQGEYIRDIARATIAAVGDQHIAETDLTLFTEIAEQAIFSEINSTLKAFGIEFKNYFNERTLYADGLIEKVVDKLRAADLMYDKEGASWLRGEQLGRPKDRVLIKSTGEPTYRLPDIAYHANKLDRGYDLVVDVFGADHKDTYPDVLAALKGLGYDTTPIKVLIHQFVTLTQHGQVVKMSTRQATFVTLDELLAELKLDVVRYFFLMRGMDSHLNFDLELARKTSDENPIYYLQYAHARMVNIARRAESFGYSFKPATADLTLLALPEEWMLMHLLWWFPEIITQVGKTLEPSTVASYLHELAAAYHSYYAVARVVTDDEPLSQARLVLTAAVRQALFNGLAILGLSAPDRM